MFYLSEIKLKVKPNFIDRRLKPLRNKMLYVSLSYTINPQIIPSKLLQKKKRSRKYLGTLAQSVLGYVVLENVSSFS